jgi:DNA-binding NarL/FixJ family response regulator
MMSQTGRGTVRVFLCDDVAELRLLTRFALEQDPGLEVVGEAGDGRACVKAIAETQPDVVVLDLAMPEVDGLEAIPLIREAAPDTRIIVFSGFIAHRLAAPVLERAARFIEKGEPLEKLRHAVWEVARESA